MRPSSHRLASPVLALVTCLGGLLAASTAAAQQSAAAEPVTSAADDGEADGDRDDAPYRFDGRGVWIGAGPGVVVGEGEAAFVSRIQVVFPVATDWFAIEGGLLGQSFSVTDHHGDRVGVDAGAITTGARFSLPPDAPLQPYAAARLAHLHYFPDPFEEDHDHDASGHADHASHHRWGAGGAIGADAGIGGASSRFRLGVEAEVLALTGPGANVLGRVIALFGVGF
jgi:hypothetical protein